MTRSFAELGVPADLVAALIAMDRPTPFPVQQCSLADSIAGRDLCVKAPTGSGKTLAFAIPVAMRATKSEPRRPSALILLPTRELAAQVRDTIEPLARARGRRVATVYGGTNISRDQSNLRRGVDILVATPGRLADLVERKDVRLDAVTLVVLDEADRMADMGFLPEVIRLLDRTATDRQTLLFSATLDGDVDTLIRRYQHDPVRHTVAEDAESDGEVRHLFWSADRDARRRLTGDIVRRIEPAIVFTRTKHGADRLAKQLRQDGIEAAAIHGNRTQSQRERALDSFRRGEVTTLVATDVAARGIHVDKVAVVVHYDLAGSEKDYQHRSGRTGRAGEPGLVVTLVDDAQHKDTAAIQRALEMDCGLHTIDLDLLRSTGQPDVTARFESAAPKGPSGPKSGARNGQRRGGPRQRTARTSTARTSTSGAGRTGSSGRTSGTAGQAANGAATGAATGAKDANAGASTAGRSNGRTARTGGPARAKGSQGTGSHAGAGARVRARRGR